MSFIGAFFTESTKTIRKYSAIKPDKMKFILMDKFHKIRSSYANTTAHIRALKYRICDIIAAVPFAMCEAVNRGTMARNDPTDLQMSPAVFKKIHICRQAGDRCFRPASILGEA